MARKHTFHYVHLYHLCTISFLKYINTTLCIHKKPSLSCCTEANAIYAAYQEAMKAADLAAADVPARPALLPPARVPGPLRSLPPLPAAARRRAQGAVLGAALADAAAMPLHWIYDAQKLASLVATPTGGLSPDPAFFRPPSCPFYSYTHGSATPYGDQSFVLLRSIVEASGLSPSHYAALNYAHFASDDYAMKGGYLDASTKGFVRNYGRLRLEAPHCGSDDEQVRGPSKAPHQTSRDALRAAAPAGQRDCAAATRRSRIRWQPRAPASCGRGGGGDAKHFGRGRLWVRCCAHPGGLHPGRLSGGSGGSGCGGAARSRSGVPA